MNFDLFRETFVLFDLDIDLVFTTEVAMLGEESEPNSSRDGLLSQIRINNITSC